MYNEAFRNHNKARRTNMHRQTFAVTVLTIQGRADQPSNDPACEHTNSADDTALYAAHSHSVRNANSSVLVM